MQMKPGNPAEQRCQPGPVTNTDPAKSTQADSEADQQLLQHAAAEIERKRAECQKQLEAEGPFADHIRKLAREQLEELNTETPESWLARERGEAERQEEVKQRARKRRHWAAWHALIEERGKRYETCRLENYEVTCPEQQRVLDAVAQYGDAIRERVNSGDGLLLIGPSGTGKDHLLIGLARRAIGADLKVRWTSGPKLFARVRQAIDRDSEGPEGVLRPVETAQILILSDLMPPTGRLTDYQVENVYRLVDERYNRLLPIWLAANARDRAELESGLGVPIVDRLVHGATVLACDWPSYRKRAR